MKEDFNATHYAFTELEKANNTIEKLRAEIKSLEDENSDLKAEIHQLENSIIDVRQELLDKQLI